MHCCVKGYCGVETMVNEDADKDRLACVRILINQGSNVNFISKNEKMTPLHWAAYHDDIETVKLLVEHGARQVKNLDGNYPVDIAAFCKHERVV
jgi:ankyrin repeat protein